MYMETNKGIPFETTQNDLDMLVSIMSVLYAFTHLSNLNH